MVAEIERRTGQVPIKIKSNSQQLRQPKLLHLININFYDLEGKNSKAKHFDCLNFDCVFMCKYVVLICILIYFFAHVICPKENTKMTTDKSSKSTTYLHIDTQSKFKQSKCFALLPFFLLNFFVNIAINQM